MEGGFQLAGYSHALASQRGADDDLSGAIAENITANLLQYIYVVSILYCPARNSS